MKVDPIGRVSPPANVKTSPKNIPANNGGNNACPTRRVGGDQKIFLVLECLPPRNKKSSRNCYYRRTQPQCAKSINGIQVK